MDVAAVFVVSACVLLVAAWPAVVDEVRQRRRERKARAHRRVQVRKADRWRCDLEEREALVAMRDVCDRVDREARP